VSASLEVEYMPDAVSGCERCEASGIFAVNIAGPGALPVPVRCCSNHVVGAMYSLIAVAP
jgi:hypothetical protein